MLERTYYWVGAYVRFFKEGPRKQVFTLGWMLLGSEGESIVSKSYPKIMKARARLKQ